MASPIRVSAQIMACRLGSPKMLSINDAVNAMDNRLAANLA